MVIFEKKWTKTELTRMLQEETDWFSRFVKAFPTEEERKELTNQAKERFRYTGFDLLADSEEERLEFRNAAASGCVVAHALDESSKTIYGCYKPHIKVSVAVVTFSTLNDWQALPNSVAVRKTIPAMVKALRAWTNKEGAADLRKVLPDSTLSKEEKHVTVYALGLSLLQAYLVKTLRKQFTFLPRHRSDKADYKFRNDVAQAINAISALGSDAGKNSSVDIDELNVSVPYAHILEVLNAHNTQPWLEWVRKIRPGEGLTDLQNVV